MTIYTIGHSNHKLETFFGFLHRFEIQLLIDIRSIPYSKYHPQFNHDVFKESVILEGIEYQYLGDKVGGKYSDSNIQFIDGGVDYSKVACLQKFLDGIDSLIKLSYENQNIVLMCVEKDPYSCHRFALISHALSKKHIISKHILPEKNIAISNHELEDKMRAEYGEKYSIDGLYAHHNWVLFHKKEPQKVQIANRSLFSENSVGENVNQDKLSLSGEEHTNFTKNQNKKSEIVEKKSKKANIQQTWSEIN